MTPEKVLKMWEALPGGERTRDTAREYAKKVKCRELGGNYLKSMGEVALVCQLRQLKRDKKIKKWAYEKERWSYQFEVQHYTPDFFITRLNDKEFVVEYKGKMTKEMRKKLLAIKNCNSDRDLRLVFERGKNKIQSKSKTTYLKWSERNKLDAADKHIPEEWL